ncbi:tellurite resistance TerB family protein [Testudinibacter sp. TR-2022]|uniref:tellurite resistance TerB family protein n=1 Tax=Testudinibacter sp. TR-2022 TaxID=2585029 RepID=UPI00111A07FE|nr:tellurite resistance TerB family protein [Testudinibacter sp. TR-2022]TNH02059.1 tellurite resistance TerB family protein [Pasteurellaceae bacterium Phil31]TNH09040.1 tellurite resistance TerB family protein [Pasteurellaceae bacterium Phil11]TNH08333.1 tellurite resistance TerB family protein [Testudinibacter sp. TR-2022]TNH08451.1 tellurite resistance TerB family protein [Testudinibacter sp. TR-2022]TNH11264.1 tellurite resistance TerB family protein [Testudinibacter sp. TR-2022]
MNNLFSQLQSRLGEMMKDENFSKIAKSAAVGGLAGLILGNSSARKGVFKAGSYAALAGAAWLAYQKWQQNKSGSAVQDVQFDPQAQQEAITYANNTLSDNKIMLLTQAMVFAARADGQIDAQEKAQIHKGLEQLGYGENADQLVNQWLNTPLDPQALAEQVNDPQQAAEVYMVSLSVIDPDHFLEQAYMQQLAQALKLPAELKQQLELAAK